MHLERGGTSSELFTTEGHNYSPRWTPDGTKIAFNSDRREGISDVYWKAVTGGEAELLVSSTYFNAAGPWTPDGRVLLYAEVRPSTGWDILTFSMEEETSQPFVTTPASESMFEFSPDGNYVAYTSNKSSQNEIYVKSYPPTDQEWIISTDGGTDPHWSPDGSELYYRDLTQNKMMVVSIKRTPAFDRGLPQVLFEGIYLSIPGPSYDVSRDGTRFLMLKGTEDKRAWTQVNVVTNWFEELKRLVPTDE